MQIPGKVAVITGAAQGFGKRLAEIIASKGGKVVLGDILEAKGHEAAGEINAKHGERVAVFQKCDVRNHAEISSLIDRAVQEFGALDIMVNNAGIGGSVPWYDDDETSISRTVDINLKAPIMGTRLAVRHFLQNGREGAVVNVASMMAFFPAEFGPTYGATKSGVVGFTASCATLATLDPPIRVNAVAPNFADTAMVKTGLNSGQNEIFRKNGILTVDEVVDQMVRCIEDDGLAGDSIKLLPGKPPLVHKGRKAVPSGVITKAPKL